MSLAPVLQRYEGVDVVRDDLVPGGTKYRILREMFARHKSIAYASPAFGGAQMALAYAARDTGGTATIFVPKRTEPHARTRVAFAAGAAVYQVPFGYLANVQAKAKRFCADKGAYYLEFGANEQLAFDVLERVAAKLWKEKGPWDEVWCAAGSGVLVRGLQLGMPSAEFHAVLVGRESNVGAAVAHRCAMPFAKEEKRAAPFTSCPNYDRKAWHACLAGKKAKRVLFWNVLGETA